VLLKDRAIDLGLAAAVVAVAQDAARPGDGARVDDGAALLWAEEEEEEEGAG
jgi:hypothetical protein